MQVTQCDRCRKTRNPSMINRWIEIRFAEGYIAQFCGVKNRDVELCNECFDEFMRFYRTPKDTN